jgi:hypothetical protein
MENVKKCTNCGEIKTLDKFRFHPNTKDKCQSYCRDCGKISGEKYRRKKGIVPLKEYLEKIGKGNPHKDKQLRKKYRKKIAHTKIIGNKKEMIKLLGGKCNRCGCQPSDLWPQASFDFHHINGSKDKIGAISTLQRTCMENKTIDDELKKCSLLCSNCHRAIHYYKKTKINQTTESV